MKKGTLLVSSLDDLECSLNWSIGDEILAVNGHSVQTSEQLRQRVADARAALPITFTVLRAKAAATAAVTLHLPRL